ncbi:MAG TPA: GNAT family N-acetyltransferase, partial [Janthinobacterium sp.]|nr:GNAT family N-acetyltransferase [Janthinobacterium sp.]
GLRRLTPADVRNFQAYRHEPGLGQYQGWSAQTDSQAAAFLAEMHAAALLQAGVWCQIGIADRATDELIGDIGVCVAHDGAEAEIGFTLRTASQGRGIAAEAVAAALALIFAHTAVERILGVTDARNLASLRLLERLGMDELETKAAIFRGEECMEHTYVIRRPRAG